MELSQRDMELFQLKKVEIPSGLEAKMENEVTPAFRSMLMRQSSTLKNNCLCSPTKHAGSFRCRLHRSPSLQRTKSMNAAPYDPTSKTTNALN
ncbi:Tubulin glycylase [Thalictrum thalictroides]|uniref:Tubulin glycylase n=1 Tax=Thalictrum thalictroides TaxID=46969 RepID=A0A7J6V1M1_THATH|nr:Tubulin glycylase [Thalictrum thalictroides]